MEFLYVSGVLFFNFVYPFISLYANVARYPSKNDAIIFQKVFILSCSLVMIGVDESLLCRAWRTDLESE